MNLQEKLFENATDLRMRAASVANAAIGRTRTRAKLAASRIDGLKGTFGVLTLAVRELNKVARRHTQSFLRENAAIAVDARNDVAALARKAYSSMRVTPPAVKAKPRKVPAVRKSAKRKAA
jgi:hypothetical protein